MCPDNRVEYFGTKTCDLGMADTWNTTTLKMNAIVKYCAKYGDSLGTTCTQCQSGYGMVNNMSCKSNLYGILIFLNCLLIVFAINLMN